MSSAKKHSLDLPQKDEAKNDDAQPNADSGGTQLEVDLDTSTKTAYFLQRSVNIFVLLCCDNILHLCPLKSVLKVPFILSLILIISVSLFTNN